MKTTAVGVAIAGLSLLNAAGQSTETAASPTNQAIRTDLLNSVPTLSERQLESMVRFPTNTTARVFGRDFTVDGALPEMARSKQPWQFISPFAPAEYGTGLGNPTTRPITRRAEGGITLLRIHF